MGPGPRLVYQAMRLQTTRLNVVPRFLCIYQKKFLSSIRYQYAQKTHLVSLGSEMVRSPIRMCLRRSHIVPITLLVDIGLTPASCQGRASVKFSRLHLGHNRLPDHVYFMSSARFTQKPLKIQHRTPLFQEPPKNCSNEQLSYGLSQRKRQYLNF